MRPSELGLEIVSGPEHVEMSEEPRPRPKRPHLSPWVALDGPDVAPAEVRPGRDPTLVSKTCTQLFFDHFNRRAVVVKVLISISHKKTALFQLRF